MAQASAIQTYQSTTVHEDLTDILINVSPTDTPFLSGFGRGPAAQNTIHEWNSDELAAPATNKQIQGAEFSFTKRTTPTRLNNRTQIFSTPVEVSDTMRAVNPAGYKDEFAYQMSKAMKEHARDIEIALVTGTGHSGDSGTVAELKGVLAFITDNVSTGATGSGGEVKLVEAFQSIWDDTGMEGSYTAYMPGNVKRQVSAFTTGATKYVETEDKRLTGSVEVYESDFGIVKLRLHRYMPAGTIAILGDEYHKTSWLRPTHKVDVAKTGDASRGVVISELTYEARADKANAKVVSMGLS